MGGIPFSYIFNSILYPVIEITIQWSSDGTFIQPTFIVLEASSSDSSLMMIRHGAMMKLTSFFL
jgi:hypothetical protein